MLFVPLSTTKLKIVKGHLRRQIECYNSIMNFAKTHFDNY